MKYIFILIFVSLIGCSNSVSASTQINRTQLYDTNGYPKWINNPTLNGKFSYGAIGSAGRSFNGPAHQRELAIQRAIKELAAQIETHVRSETTSRETVTENTTSYQSRTTSTFKINNKVSGKIIDTWKDLRNNQFYVWMIIE